MTSKSERLNVLSDAEQDTFEDGGKMLDLDTLLEGMDLG